MDNKEIISKLKGDLLTFGKFIAPNTFWAPPSVVHYEMQDLLLDHTKKKVNLIEPRGLAKSTLAGEIYPLYHIFMEDIGQPKLVVLISKDQKGSVDRLGAIKNILDFSKPFRQLFGYWGEHTAKWWRHNDVKLKDGSRIVCLGTGQKIRGIKEDYVRPTLIIGDDLEDENNTKTAEAMQHNLNWIMAGADYSLDTRHGRVIIIGTPLHQSCIVEQLATMSNWHTIRHSYLNEDETESIWAEVKSVNKLLEDKKAKEEQGKLRIWYMETQCKVIGDEDQLFKPDYFRYWDGNLEIRKGETYLNITHLHKVQLPEQQLKPVNVFLGIDPASSQSETADYTVIMPIAVDDQKNIYILPYVRKRMTPSVVADEIVRMAKVYKPKKAGIETTGYQEMLREIVRERMREEGVYVAGLEREDGFKPRTEKSKRLERLHYYFYHKKIYMQPQMSTLRDELLMYPRSKHDDVMDSLDYATKRIYPPDHDIEDQKDDLEYFLTNTSNTNNWKVA